MHIKKWLANPKQLKAWLLPHVNALLSMFVWGLKDAGLHVYFSFSKTTSKNQEVSCFLSRAQRTALLLSKPVLLTSESISFGKLVGWGHVKRELLAPPS